MWSFDESVTPTKCLPPGNTAHRVGISQTDIHIDDLIANEGEDVHPHKGFPSKTSLGDDRRRMLCSLLWIGRLTLPT